jgi:Ca-activated chloride channel family protein
MNRKTTTILCAAGGLAVAAAILGTRPPASGSHLPPPIPDPKPPLADMCHPDSNLPSRAAASFGAGDMSAALSGADILMGSDGEMYLTVDLAAREAAVAERPPLNVAIVLDHSGSMAGEKIQAARAAAHGIVERLRASDHVALIQFDDVAEVLVPSIAVDESGRARLDAAINSISDRGGTNIHGGLVLGRDEVLRSLQEGSVNRVILMSDGNANVGITDTPRLAQLASDASEKGIRLTTVGLGLDYNEDLMEALAERGRGQYYYVKDAAGLQPVFAGELKSIQGTVATRAELRLEPACAGVQIAEVYGYQTRKDGDAVVIPLSDLSGGDQRKIVARLRVPTGTEGHLSVVRASLSAADTKGGAAHTTYAALGVDVTKDVALVEKNADPSVVGQVQQAQSSIALRHAAEEYERGDQDKAVRIIQEQRAHSVAMQKKYNIADKDLAPVFGSLDEMGAGMAANKPASPAAPAFTKSAKEKANHLAK